MRSPTPSGARVVRLMTDYAADPVWFDDGMVALEDLPITPRLRTALRSWADEWERILGREFEVREKDRYRRWLQAGRLHAVDLQRELGSGYRVVYWHENEKV